MCLSFQLRSFILLFFPERGSARFLGLRLLQFSWGSHIEVSHGAYVNGIIFPLPAFQACLNICVLPLPPPLPPPLPLLLLPLHSHLAARLLLCFFLICCNRRAPKSRQRLFSLLHCLGCFFLFFSFHTHTHAHTQLPAH